MQTFKAPIASRVASLAVSSGERVAAGADIASLQITGVAEAQIPPVQVAAPIGGYVLLYPSIREGAMVAKGEEIFSILSEDERAEADASLLSTKDHGARQTSASTGTADSLKAAGAAVSLDSPTVGQLSISDLDFEGRYATSPSGVWRIAVESGTEDFVRWALVRDKALRSSGSTQTDQVFTMAVADDATFVLARRTGRNETTVEVREASGKLLVSNVVEALADSCVFSASGRWVAVGFVEAKRGDDPVLLIDADQKRLYRRIPAKGGTVRSINEERRVIETADGIYDFGPEPLPPVVLPVSQPSPEPLLSTWQPQSYTDSVVLSHGPSRWLWAVVGVVAVGVVARMILVALFVSTAPAALKGLQQESVTELAKSAVQTYEMAKRHGSKEDICHAAGEVATFYLRAHNEQQYSHWKSVQEHDCDAAASAH